MNISFAFGLGITLIFGFLQFAVKEIPEVISLSGIGIGLLLIVYASIKWLYAKLHSKKQPSPANLPQKPNVSLLPAQSQLNLHNHGTENIYLWGTKFAEAAPNIEKEPRIIPVGNFYYFLTDNLEAEARNVIGSSGEKLVPFEAYLSDLSNNRYIAKFGLLIQIKNGVVKIHTQQLGVRNTDWQRTVQ